MSRNTDSHFGLAPMKNIRRSSFKRPCSYSTTGNTGEIIPFLADEVLPGDTVKMHTASLVRMLTPIAPVMDNAWMDTYFFFVPRRLVWEHWKEFMGENTTDAWTQETEYQIPQLETPSGGWNKGTLGEKLYGIQGREGSVDACYARAYALIFNEWFRNQNITEPAEVYTGDATKTGTNGTDYVVDMQLGGQLAKAVKYADYFTRGLPEPQKGPDVYLPLGTIAPVGATATTHDFFTARTHFEKADGTSATGGNLGIDENGYLLASGTTGSSPVGVRMDNLWVDLSEASSATINELRQAFAIQRMYEIDARGGRAKACASSIKKSRKKTGRLNQMAS